MKPFSTQVFLKLELVKIFLSFSWLDKVFMKLCKSLSFCRKVTMRFYRTDTVECNLEFIVFCYSYCRRVSPEHFMYVWNYCAIFSSVLLITDLFGFYLCSFLFLLPHDLTHLFCCWCLRQMSLEVSVRGLEQQSHTETDAWILWPREHLPGKGEGPLSSIVHCRRTRAINCEFTAIYYFYCYYSRRPKVPFVLRPSPKGLPILSW